MTLDKVAQHVFWTDKMLEAGENQQERNARRRNG
jgi:hypothetical protein